MNVIVTHAPETPPVPSWRQPRPPPRATGHLPRHHPRTANFFPVHDLVHFQIHLPGQRPLNSYVHRFLLYPHSSFLSFCFLHWIYIWKGKETKNTLLKIKVCHAMSSHTSTAIYVQNIPTPFAAWSITSLIWSYGSVSAGREKWPFNVLFFFLSRASVWPNLMR